MTIGRILSFALASCSALCAVPCETISGGGSEALGRDVDILIMEYRHIIDRMELRIGYLENKIALLERENRSLRAEIDASALLAAIDRIEYDAVEEGERELPPEPPVASASDAQAVWDGIASTYERVASRIGDLMRRGFERQREIALGLVEGVVPRLEGFVAAWTRASIAPEDPASLATAPEASTSSSPYSRATGTVSVVETPVTEIEPAVAPDEEPILTERGAAPDYSSIRSAPFESTPPDSIEAPGDEWRPAPVPEPAFEPELAPAWSPEPEAIDDEPVPCDSPVPEPSPAWSPEQTWSPAPDPALEPAAPAEAEPREAAPGLLDEPVRLEFPYEWESPPTSPRPDRWDYR